MYDISEHKRIEGELKTALNKLEKKAARFELLAHTAGELLRTAEPQKLLETLCKGIMEHLDCQVFFNYLLDNISGKLYLNGCAGIPQNEIEKIKWLDFGVAIYRCLARQEYKIVFENINEIHDSGTELLRSYGIKAYACYPLLSDEGNVIGTLSFGSKIKGWFEDDDLSFIKEATDHVAIAMVRMERLLELQKSQAQLQQRANELAEVKKELETFTNSVVHDLRAPIRSMIGFSDILIEDYSDKLDTEGINHLNRIRNAGVKMNELVDNIIVLSNTTHQEMVRQNVNLYEITQTIVDELRSTDSQREVNIDLMKEMYVTGDLRLLKIALTNLIKNSWIYTKRKSNAYISIGVMEQDRQRVFYVKDNGAGFDMKNAESLFEPLKRFHAESEFPGTGIGLTIVDRIIKRHGG
ncbi:MAG TPA: ATP-binding protein, partial [Chitinispirillaceae bacterium]|nr:ATP-binding protein [Chitinispirillaceae bacterium]